MEKQQFCTNHPDRPVKCKGLCRSCYEKDLKERNPEYAERQKQNSLNYQKKNRERITAYDRERDAIRRQVPEYKDKKFFASIKREYGVTEEQYKKFLSDCDNKCTLCFRPPYEGKRLHLDHNHKTGKVRGLLCTSCNWYLHKVEADPNILERIKNYINE